jgi:hypothetical protein
LVRKDGTLGRRFGLIVRPDQNIHVGIPSREEGLLGNLYAPYPFDVGNADPAGIKARIGNP